MKCEVKQGSRNRKDLILVVTFEKDSNFDVEKHEWVPRLKEVMTIKTILETICKVQWTTEEKTQP